MNIINQVELIGSVCDDVETINKIQSEEYLSFEFGLALPYKNQKDGFDDQYPIKVILSGDCINSNLDRLTPYTVVRVKGILHPNGIRATRVDIMSELHVYGR